MYIKHGIGIIVVWRMNHMVWAIYDDRLLTQRPVDMLMVQNWLFCDTVCDMIGRTFDGDVIIRYWFIYYAYYINIEAHTEVTFCKHILEVV